MIPTCDNTEAYPEKPEVVVEPEIQGQPEGRKCPQGEDVSRFFVLSFGEGVQIGDDGLGEGDRGAEPQDFPAETHGSPHGIGLLNFGCHFIAEMRLAFVGIGVDGAEVA